MGRRTEILLCRPGPRAEVFILTGANAREIGVSLFNRAGVDSAKKPTEDEQEEQVGNHHGPYHRPAPLRQCHSPGEQRWAGPGWRFGQSAGCGGLGAVAWKAGGSGI
jgi:hypothetical protein